MSACLASPASLLLARYEKIAAITRVMADAAAGNDWDTARAFCQQYSKAVAVLCDESDAPLVLSREERRRKHVLLRQILAHDAATRAATMPSLARLGAMLGGAKRQQMLRQTYGTSMP